MAFNINKKDVNSHSNLFPNNTNRLLTESLNLICHYIYQTNRVGIKGYNTLAKKKRTVT